MDQRSEIGDTEFQHYCAHCQKRRVQREGDLCMYCLVEDVKEHGDQEPNEQANGHPDEPG